MTRGEGTIGQVLSGGASWCVVHGEGVSTGTRPPGVDWGDMNVLATLPDQAVHHVLTDPPFSEHVHTRQRRLTFPDSGTAPSRAVRHHELGFDHFRSVDRRAFAAQCARLASGWVIAFSDFESVHLLRRSLVAAGLRHWRVGAWDKCETGAPQFNGCGPAQWGEAIEIAHSVKPYSWNGGGARAVWRHVTEIARSDPANAKRGRKDRHPCAKPVPLCLELIEDFTHPDDVIVDPYAGGGAFGVAAIRAGRRAILIERDQQWIPFIRERLRAEQSGSTLAARRAGQGALFG